MSKLSKISKISKFTKITKILNHSCIFFFSFSSCWPLMSQSLCYSGLRLAPLPPAQPLSLSTMGLNILCVWKFQPFPQIGGGEQMGTLGKNGAWGDATCTCPRTCVSRPCSSLCMVARVLALQVWLSNCLMVSGREDLSLHVSALFLSSGWLPQYTWDSLTLSLFCSFTFRVNVTHKQ